MVEFIAWMLIVWCLASLCAFMVYGRDTVPAPLKVCWSFAFALFVGIGLVLQLPPETPQDTITLDEDCYVYLPHADYQQEGDFNAWMATLPPFTNLDYRDGKWFADDKVVAYGDAEDSAITNGKCND